MTIPTRKLVTALETRPYPGLYRTFPEAVNLSNCQLSYAAMQLCNTQPKNKNRGEIKTKE